MAILTHDPLTTAIEQLTDDMRDLMKLGALSRDLFNLRVQVWRMSARVCREARRYRDEIQEITCIATGQEIDPDDSRSDHVLRTQQSIHDLMDVYRQIFPSPLSWGYHWIERWTVSRLTACHRDLGLARQWIMEHDADCSPVVDEVFDSSDAFIAALNRKAA